MTRHEIYSSILEQRSSIVVLMIKQIKTNNHRLLGLKNLNGGSVDSGNKCAFSEFLSFDVLNSVWGARFVRSESEIVYLDPNGKKTDMIILINDALVAVSVTRAMHIRTSNGHIPFDRSRGYQLVQKKINGIIESNVNVDTDDQCNRWCHHILFIWCEDERIMNIILDMSKNLIPNMTLVVCTSPETLNSRLY